MSSPLPDPRLLSSSEHALLLAVLKTRAGRLRSQALDIWLCNLCADCRRMGLAFGKGAVAGYREVKKSLHENSRLSHR